MTQDTNTEWKVGDVVNEKGEIFIGTWTPKDRQGNSLGQVFDLFAAKRDVQTLNTFNALAEYVANMENGFNHLQGNTAPDKVLYDALQNGSYQGEYFIPTYDIAIDHLYENQDKFVNDSRLVAHTTSASDPVSHIYATSSERAVNTPFVYTLNMVDNRTEKSIHNQVIHKDRGVLSARLVRAQRRR